MRTFQEWVSENHPEDDLLSEFFANLAKKASNSRLGRSILATGAMALGSMMFKPRDAEGAMPMAPSITNNTEEGYSAKPFDRRVGPQPSGAVAKNMDEFELWAWQIKKIKRMEDEYRRLNLAKQKGAMVREQPSLPIWYLNYGNHYGWKYPSAPGVLTGGVR